jgi:hypothetical protein
MLTGTRWTIHRTTLSNTTLGTLLSAYTGMYFSHKVVWKFHSGKEQLPLIITIREYSTQNLLHMHETWLQSVLQVLHLMKHAVLLNIWLKTCPLLWSQASVSLWRSGLGHVHCKGTFWWEAAIEPAPLPVLSFSTVIIIPPMLHTT